MSYFLNFIKNYLFIYLNILKILYERINSEFPQLSNEHLYYFIFKRNKFLFVYIIQTLLK
jgi:hypothetical protein